MDSTLQLYLSPDSSPASNGGKIQTPADIGNSLFQTLLSKNCDSSEFASFGTAVYDPDGSTAGRCHLDNRELAGTPQGKKLEKKIGSLGLTSFPLVLPETALPQLVAFLKDQGFTEQEIDKLILSMKNDDGFLHLDKLLARLLIHEKRGTGEAGNPVIQRDQIPKMEELLFRMGLGAGEVKAVIEKSANEKGDLVLDRLGPALEKYFQVPSSESGLLSVLAHHNIPLKSDTPFMDNEVDPDLKKEFLHFMETPSQDVQKKIKQNIAGLLREKGIPPQEVKSFLETLNVELTRSALKGNSAKNTHLSSILDQAVMRNRSGWQKDKWQEKILAILKDERLLITKDSNLSLSQERGNIHNHLAELSNRGDMNARQFLLFAGSKDRMTSEFDKTKDMIEKGNRSFLIKDSLETGVMPNRTDRVLGDIGLVKQGNQNPNLPQPLPKVLDRMIWMIRAGEQKSSIRIHPPELGRLDLDLAIKNGHLQANLSAESTMVKEVIEANLNQLKQHLNAQGLIVDSFEVMVGLNDRRFKDGELWSGNRRNASSSKRSIASGNASVITKEPSGRPVDHMYQIDVHV